MVQHGSVGAATPGHRHHLPPMGLTWLLPLYDPFTQLVGMRRVHRRLVDGAWIAPGHRVLEIGCGTGNLLLHVKQRHPAADVVGLDPDVDALERARRKAARAAVAVQLDRGFADQLPYPDASVDRVLSSFMLHHVDQAEKPRAMREVRRVLRPGGSLHVVDMAGPRHPEGHGVRLLRRSSRLAENLDDGIPDLLREAGFADVVEGGYSSVFGIRCTFYRAADA